MNLVNIIDTHAYIDDHSGIVLHTRSSTSMCVLPAYTGQSSAVRIPSVLPWIPTCKWELLGREWGCLHACECREYYCMVVIARLPDLFNVAWEKRGSLVKLITCVMSGRTNFHIWHNGDLARLWHELLTKSSSSSIWSLQLAMNQQAEALQSLCCMSKTAICTVTHVLVGSIWAWTQSSYHDQASLDYSQLAIVPYVEVCSTWRHTHDKFYQAPPPFSCNVEKIREPGDEAMVVMWCTYNICHVILLLSLSPPLPLPLSLSLSLSLSPPPSLHTFPGRTAFWLLCGSSLCCSSKI